MITISKSLFSMAVAAVLLCSNAMAEEENWVSIFNGQDLDGWSPKITGYENGENYGETFRVVDGKLAVGYENYEEFGTRFGHLFYKDSFKNYRMRLEYRFIGEQCPGGPGWALRNSGIMIHCQDPATMDKDQEFPVSIEVQLLGGDGEKDRTTGNLCTPGTNVEMDGKLVRRHCTNSESETYHGEQWVVSEIEVRGDEYIRHLINGDVVLEYQKPQLDDKDKDAKKIIVAGDLTLDHGYISLQSESHPVEFRKIEILNLDEK